MVLGEPAKFITGLTGQ